MLLKEPGAGNGARARVRFAADLAVHGDRVAVIDPSGEVISYRELDARVARAADVLGAERSLVLLAAANDVTSLVSYLAALRGGHPVLLVSAADRRNIDALVDAYDPDVLVAGAQVRRRRTGTRHDLHPDLALLLSTSGSTGSPKLVRLSADSLAANAAAIAAYLDIRDSDRAALSLPLHYCYGLSVVNSNLLRGAGVLLCDGSVTEPRFWDAVRRHGVTSLHGVPHTFELLDRVGFDAMALPSLRYVTQAGGRLAPAAVLRYARLGARAGWRFFVMYGQTEATARMAYLPPELAATHPAAVGVPIPGGSFALRDGVDGVGELVYRGPNVMLGYAESPSDLALGRTVDELATGDLARRGPDGLYEVMGRLGRIVKPFGLRVDLDRVERLLAEQGCTVACAGDDDGLVVAVTAGPDVDAVRDLVADRCGLPAGSVEVREVVELPRLTNGKIDYVALGRKGSDSGPTRSVRAAFAGVFPLQRLDDDATFVDLGGDSLSYVQTAVELERVLGHLPPDWHTATIRELERTTPRHGAWAAMETGIALRAVAIVLVVGTHVGLFHVLGGAHLLLAVAGWMFARFLLSDVGTDGRPAGATSRRILRTAWRIALPAALWIGYRAAVSEEIELRNAALLNQFLDPSAVWFWYLEVLVQTLLLLAVLFAVPAVRRLQLRSPFAFALGILLVALAARAHPELTATFVDRFSSIQVVLWLFALGWVAYAATGPAQRAVVVGLVLLLVPGFFGDPSREAVVAAGVLVLLLVPTLPVPRVAVRLVGLVASASLYVYLTHYAVYVTLLPVLPSWAVLGACLGVGILAWSLAERWAPRLVRHAATTCGIRRRPADLG